MQMYTLDSVSITGFKVFAEWDLIRG